MEIFNIKAVHKVHITMDDDFDNFEENIVENEKKAVEAIAKAYKCDSKAVKLTKIYKGSVHLEFTINIEDIIDDMNQVNEKKDRMAKTEEEIRINIKKTFGKPLIAAVVKKEKTFKLSTKDFNSAYDRKMTG